VAGSYHGDAVFQGVTLDAGARTFAPPVGSRIIEFVGDSITVGQLSSKQALTAYGWLVGERLHAEHTQIAQGGACLVATADGCVGLSVQFAKTSSLPDAPDWDFRRYQAAAVVINLGTNDVGHGVHTPQFQDTYVGLLQTVRAKYPGAVIFAMRNFKGRFGTQTSNAVAIRNAAGDGNVVFVDTTGWIDPTVDTVDGTHPNDAGHQKIAARLAPVLAARIGA
jgi:lysophospholipase L1-like esterase